LSESREKAAGKDLITAVYAPALDFARFGAFGDRTLYTSIGNDRGRVTPYREETIEEASLSSETMPGLPKFDRVMTLVDASAISLRHFKIGPK
jgi:hypothetical protein